MLSKRKLQTYVCTKGAELYIMHRKPVLRKVERTTEKCTEIFTLTQCIVTSGDTMEGNAAQEL